MLAARHDKYCRRHQVREGEGNERDRERKSDWERESERDSLSR